ncbi:1-acyl-sn-glycerol-3-phosphate acyltransferase [Gregarina niphandrodes]|uniref:1-acyl-sn-glycerol-3-phosphate acyltransferase n=1 Tax=Gregarina niphandrodes TaxID=110365 RepID=A0A023B8Z9_GRENI|nr:1-acyl-sn-glycerol-3-phosphate acyltransferase [Gregarina niphandrodes]EZG70677.1 1-acyl-sn-glycerol-3-phosphate acyltransferase [Gregarina niphandrodes]|eukprot:XP_011129897.1 1-acyl-sn-glycerol-3-phosphate acyltransferase [Gregarina niphandrodes]
METESSEPLLKRMEEAPLEHPLNLAQRPKQNVVIRLIVSLFLWVTIPFGVLGAITGQVLSLVLLWPVFWFRPALKVWFLGWILRFSVTCSSFFFNPFWRLKRVRLVRGDYRPHGRTLVMCNHLTQADPWIFSRGLWPWEFKWVYKADLLRIPVVGQILRMSHDIPLKFTRDKGGWGTERGQVKVMMDTVYEMGTVYDIGTVVFPEGTRSKTGRLQPFKDGFFKFAVEHDWEILPCVAHNSQTLWPLSSTLFGCGTVYFSVGDVIKPEPGESFESLKYRTREAMAQLVREMPLFNPETDDPMAHDADVLERGQGILAR